MRKGALAVLTAAIVGLSAPLGAGPLAAGRADAATVGQQAFAPDLVRAIQRSLNQKGYGVGRVDGVFGADTRTALAQFQRDNSLPGGGQIDHQTLAALGITGVIAQNQPVPVPSSRQTVSARMVQDIQGELQRLGYDPGRADGVWDRRTQRALRDFQHDRNLAASGRIDEQTLAALEAGGAPQVGQLPSGTRR